MIETKAAETQDAAQANWNQKKTRQAKEAIVKEKDQPKDAKKEGLGAMLAGDTSGGARLRGAGNLL